MDRRFLAFLLICLIVLGPGGFFKAPQHSKQIDIYQQEDMCLIKCSAIEGDMSFRVGEKEYIRICENGTFYVNNNEVATDKEIYNSFKEWIKTNKGDIIIRR